MKSKLLHNSALIPAMSLMAIAASVPQATAQEETDDVRRMSTIVVTTQKREESIQDVPIAVSAFDENSLDNLQLAGGPDLVKSIPNVSFTRGNFSGFNFKVRGVGVDAVATSADAGVGVHINEMPILGNRLFEAEFYDVERVEVLRGPQGTIFGRNATAGVFNMLTARPQLGEFGADVRASYGNHNAIKLKGHVNLPLGENAAVRVAGSFLQRDGYVDNLVTGNNIDNRDLWSARASLAWEPTDRFNALLMVEHFEEDSTRLRSGKQLCKKDPNKTSFNGIAINPFDALYNSQGCVEARLDASPDRVNSTATLGGGLAILAGLLDGDINTTPQLLDNRVVESPFDPTYQAEQTLVQLRMEYDLTDNLKLTSITGHNNSVFDSLDDYNKLAPDGPFNAAAGAFMDPLLAPLYPLLFPGGVVTDPQLGASNQFRTFDNSAGEADQFYQEIRLNSDFDGRFNFILGASYIDQETNPFDNGGGYYVFSNSLTALAQLNNAAGGAIFGGLVNIDNSNPNAGTSLDRSSFDGSGGNYFRSFSPYRLEALGVFGEAYFDLTDNLKLTAALRYTDDDKEQDVTPSILFAPGATFQITGLTVADLPGETTFKAGFDWTPDLAWTDDTLFYGSYSQGYKAGGINPPVPVGVTASATFEPETLNAIEFGTKNTFDDGKFQLNASAFMYDYKDYQITQIIQRSSLNFNVDAELTGLEVEAIANPIDSLIVNLNLGLLNSSLQDEFGIDVLNRTQGRTDLVVLKNAATYSNCVVSAAGYEAILNAMNAALLPAGSTRGLCSGAFVGAEAGFGLTAADSVTFIDSEGNTQTAAAFTPFDGHAANLDGNSMPNAPDMTLNVGAEYTFYDVKDTAWALTFRADWYRQSASYSRIWNTGRDHLPSWSNTNIGIQLQNPDKGLMIEFFGKNITDEEVITGAYLTDDSSGLFTNIFLTDPATYGISISKSW